MLAKIILFAPLLGALIGGFGWRIIGEKGAQWVTTGLLFLAAVLSWIVFLGLDASDTQHISILRWVESGTLSTDWSIRLDRLTAIMLIVVTTVSALVHLYSFGYMDHDPQWKDGESYKPRFFAYLSFFTFAMLMLVTSDNLLQMFFGWEGVGVASYLLIGFYYRKPSANAAAIKPLSPTALETSVLPWGSLGFITSPTASALMISLPWRQSFRRWRSISCGVTGMPPTFWPFCCSLALWENLRSSFCTHGYRMRWRARHPFLR